MKKFVLAALLLGLTVGSTYASAVSVCAVAQSEIPDSHVCILIEESASFFAITVEEATQAYEQGDLTITQIGKNTYRVAYSGGANDWLIDGDL